MIDHVIHQLMVIILHVVELCGVGNEIRPTSSADLVYPQETIQFFNMMYCVRRLHM